MGLLIGLGLFVLLALRVPVAFALAFTGILFPVMFKGTLSISPLGEAFFANPAEFTLLSIPMFILMGAAVAASPAGKDVYEALDRWLKGALPYTPCMVLAIILLFIFPQIATWLPDMWMGTAL